MFVIRKPVEFTDGWQWIYACQCTHNQMEFLSSLSQSVPLEASGKETMQFLEHLLNFKPANLFELDFQ